MDWTLISDPRLWDPTAWPEPWLRLALLALGLGAGALFGAAVASVWASRRLRRSEAERAALVSREQERAALLVKTEAELAGARAGESEASIRVARLEEELRGERRLVTEQRALVERAEESLREAFQSLSSEALRRNNTSFLELARSSFEAARKEAQRSHSEREQALDGLLKPIASTLEQVDQQLRAVEKERVGAYRQIHEQVTEMARTQAALHGETANLTRALREPNVRGQWGEMQLRRVIEMSGMLERCDFVTQTTVRGDGGGGLRPDVVVQLPGGQNVIIDAKTPLDAYLQAHASDEAGARQAALADHAKRVRQHISELGSKGYWQQFRSTPEFVVMFLPGEAFFGAALDADPALLEYGVQQRVIVASPTTLIALLRAVAWGWRQEALAENAQQISEAGRVLQQRMATLVDHLRKLGRGVGQTVKAFNQTVGSLDRTVMPAARKLAELGAGSEPPEPVEPVEQLPRDVSTTLALPGLEDESGGEANDRDEG